MSFEDRLKRVSNITLGILASLWMLVQLYFTFVQPMHPMTLSPIFLCFALAIVFINKPFPGSGKYPWLRVIDFFDFSGIWLGDLVLLCGTASDYQPYPLYRTCAGGR